MIRILNHQEAKALVEEHGGIRPASRATGYSFGAIRRALLRSDEAPKEAADDMLSEEDAEQLRSDMANVQATNARLFKQLKEARDRTNALVQATVSASRDAVFSGGYTAPTIYVPSMVNNNNMPEAVLWHMTDFQGGKETTSYNRDVMRERVLRFVKKAISVTQVQRADHPVDELVIALGGDMIEGLFNFPTQPYEIDGTIFVQYVSVARLLVDVVKIALVNYPTVKVVAEWGNHGRIGSKRDAVPRSDNVDRMVYELARQLLQDEERLTWEDCPEDIQRIEVGNYRALLIHGDEVGRMGYASRNTIANHVTRWRSGSYPWDFTDVYVGHYHQHAEDPLASGRGAIFYTGSTESDNRYALVGMAASATPTQRLHFIDKERGRVTAQYKMFVDED